MGFWGKRLYLGEHLGSPLRKFQIRRFQTILGALGTLTKGINF